MDRADRILAHPVFRDALAEIDRWEQERRFCRHGLPHALDVARLMLIYSLEANAETPRDVIYAAALLHDLGRAEQYARGASHEQASQVLAGPILADCGYSGQEIAEILSAIGSHREGGDTSSLGALLYWADKKSRPCYACPVAEECHWPAEKKNLFLER